MRSYMYMYIRVHVHVCVLVVSNVLYMCIYMIVHV